MTGSLQGKRIVVTRPRTQAAPMASMLRDRGATPVLFPTIEIVPAADTEAIDRTIAELHSYDWIIFTSTNGVAVLVDRVEELTSNPPQFGAAHIAAIGPATAKELERCGAVPTFVPEEFVADRIPDGLGDVRGKRILLPRASRARKDLAVELDRRGASVTEVAVYDTVAPSITAGAFAELERGCDAVTFTSSSSVEHFVDMVGERQAELLRHAVVACIGPITDGTARGLGLRVDLVAERYTTEGLVDALDAHFAETANSHTDAGQ